MKRNKRLRKQDIDPNAIPRQYFVFFVVLLIISWLTIGYILKHPMNKSQTIFKRRYLKRHERQTVFPPPKSKFGNYHYVLLSLFISNQ